MTSRYRPPPSNRRLGFSLGLALPIAVSVRGMGATSRGGQASVPQCCTNMPPDVDGRYGTDSDAADMEKPAITRACGVCWMSWEAQLAPGPPSNRISNYIICLEILRTLSCGYRQSYRHASLVAPLRRSLDQLPPGSCSRSARPSSRSICRAPPLSALPAARALPPPFITSNTTHYNLLLPPRQEGLRLLRFFPCG